MSSVVEKICLLSCGSLFEALSFLTASSDALKHADKVSWALNTSLTVSLCVLLNSVYIEYFYMNEWPRQEEVRAEISEWKAPWKQDVRADRQVLSK